MGAPSGSVTFVFTDVEGSTPLFRELGSQFVGLLEDHNRIVRTAVAEHHGYEVRTEGDAFFLAFSDPVQAVATCLDAQLAIARHRWPVDRALRVRMGLHTGEAEPTGDGDYVALPVHQAARVSSAAHGGQVLLSEQTAGLLRGALPLGAGLADRGSFQLKGFDQPQQLYQLTFPGLADNFPPLRAAPAIPNNLPDLRTTFVGRDTELPTLEELIAANRLVSVVGPGGAGKTRLSLELAARNASSFQAGAHLADLSPLAEPALVPSAIAAAFGIREEPGTDLFEAVGRRLDGRTALLVMDNCEHLIAAAAEAVERLLETVDGVRLLVTSREALALPGELIWRLAPLSVVDADATAEQVRSCDAGRLFEERAALSRVGYTVSSADAEHVAAICRALEGLPLAIELAAARVSTMSLERMAAQLGRRDAVLGFGSRRGRGRHASLESTIDWSYQLLDEAEQQTLRALSIFVAGFTAAAAERIVGLASLLDHLAALVDKSLIVYDEDADRYRLLESIREFARIRLDGEGEAEAVGSAHLRWYADVATSSLEQSMTSRDVETFAMVDREIDNFRAAMVFAEKHADPRGLQLVAGLHAYWSYRAPAEARLWTDRLLAAVPQAEPLQIAYALATRADSEFMTGGIERPLRDSAKAVALARTSGETLALMRCLMTRALVTFAPGDGESKAAYLDVERLAEESGFAFFQGAALGNLSILETSSGNHQAALEYAQRSLDVWSTCDAPAFSQAMVRLCLGIARLRAGHSPDAVRTLMEEAFEYAARVRLPAVLAGCLVGLAWVIAAGEPESAAALLGAANGLRSRHGLRVPEVERYENEAVLEQVERFLGADNAAKAMRASGVLSLDQAIRLGRRLIQHARAGEPHR